MTNLDSVLKSKNSAYSQGYEYSAYSQADMSAGKQRRQNTKELMLSNCGVGEDS